MLAAEFLTAAALLRAVLGRHAGIAPADVRVDRRCPDCSGHHGRPRPLDSPELGVSVAHAGGRVAVAVAHGMRAGVDVERSGRVTDADSLSAAVCSPGEAEYVRAQHPALRPRVLVDLWTRKEAVLKLLGTGLRVPPRLLEVAAPGRPPALHPPADTDVRLPAALTLRPLTACGPGFTATLATSKAPAALREQPAEALLASLRSGGSA
ncbi:4'-phosphopantetheinyl transferase family protein [Streptomyces nogalater]|uniref:4'-phosphopantetheinyl transferase family protein n=1 Tax=Streptomyces nogalater TaxID=38314 RepID=A0ABW0WA64_STRNO